MPIFIIWGDGRGQNFELHYFGVFRQKMTSFGGTDIFVDILKSLLKWNIFLESEWEFLKRDIFWALIMVLFGLQAKWKKSEIAANTVK